MTSLLNRTYVYIDGESHYIRSENALRKMFGEETHLDQLRYSDEDDERLILVKPKAKIFWTRRMNPDVQRAIYFTSASGDAPAQHEMKIALREFGLEPHIVQERSDLKSQRHNLFKTEQIIEKAKGVDIALATRMIVDSYNNIFDKCYLYTSDVDFVPVIEAVMARGKHVIVYGYCNGISNQSQLLHVPDRFVDLESVLSAECKIASKSPLS